MRSDEKVILFFIYSGKLLPASGIERVGILVYSVWSESIGLVVEWDMIIVLV